MQVDPLAQVGDILRALVRNARNVIFVNEQDGGVVAVLRGISCTSMTVPSVMRPMPSSQVRRSRSSSAGPLGLRRKNA